MSNQDYKSDVILIGAGIMSATLGTILKELVPEWKITILEKLPKAGEESSNEWNNAGTGHAALCELNYTNEKPDGSIDLSKAEKINEHFQISKQFWSYLVDQKRIRNPHEFIMPLPHISFVHGDDNVTFLKKRYEAMRAHPLFRNIEYSEDPQTLKDWFPLMMEKRDPQQPVAATKIDGGTDVNFGALTLKLTDHLKAQNVSIQYNRRVDNLTQQKDGSWELKVKNEESGQDESHGARFVFIGGGGKSLHLLQKSGIPEGKGIGGFPVSGQFMVCKNPDVIQRHNSKVYGKAPVGAPPMSVPHLDTRYIENKRTLLFGPFAGFSPKFLKTGSMFDLFTSIKPNNVLTMLAAGGKEMALTKYLIGQVLLSKEKRMDALREFVPDAKSEDWELVVSGQRVQVIKDTEENGKGTLQFGTEVITSEDGSIAALLGASPGASTAVHVMLDILNRCFPEEMKEWEPKIKEMIPSYGHSLIENTDLLQETERFASEKLGLSVEEQLDHA
ncbi:malate dehydrogenase (quinone) [Alkalicoccus daliensis]|uniref:Probable malate:quinone oxidoreductase n=1 Tax=Alkalicoccus daliensis TaxID=745820 RepID=A0A1H0FU06_9BACI|nr:malate dehydrogenase (quinone) [Alkalicoccus daliensis]SDN98042.1 malate dehydrogenase (quinone) [Alkalicoccus daliensis]